MQKLRFIWVVLGVLSLLPTFLQAQQVDLFIPFQRGGKWGFSDTLGNIVIPTVYDRVWHTNKRNTIFRISEGQHFGLINADNEVVLSPQYDWIKLHHQCIQVVIERAYRTFTLTGKPLLAYPISDLKEIVVDNQYFYLIRTLTERAAVFQVDKHGQALMLVDTTALLDFYTLRDADLLRDLASTSPQTRRRKFAQLRANQESQLVYEDVAIDEEPSNTHSPSAFTLGTSTLHVLNTKNAPQLMIRYRQKGQTSKRSQTDTISMDATQIVIMEGDLWCPIVDSARMEKTLVHQYARVTDRAGKMGVVNAKAEWILPPIYDSIDLVPLTHNMEEAPFFRCQQAGRWGVVDGANQVVVNLKYDSIRVTLEMSGKSVSDNTILRRTGYPVRYGLVVCVGNTCGVTGEDGALRAPIEMDEITLTDYGYSLQKAGKWGFAAVMSEVYVPPIFTCRPLPALHLFPQGQYVSLQDKSGVVIGYANVNGRLFYKTD